MSARLESAADRLESGANQSGCGADLYGPRSRPPALIGWLPTLVTLGAALGLLVYGRVAQFPDYHAFADQRALLGIPRAADVLSNIGFLLVGASGVYRLWTDGRRAIADGAWSGYLIFCVSLIATAAGSAFYHLAPDDHRIIWDRLPIALACAGLLGAVRAECSPGPGDHVRTGLLVAAAIASVLWWSMTNVTGAGDLRPYLLLQSLPLVLIPLWQAVHRIPRRRRLVFAAAMPLYVLAKGAELGDRVVFGALGLVSGHTLKHVIAALAAGLLVRVIVPPARYSRVAGPSPVANELVW